jgi:hypothetical protein
MVGVFCSIFYDFHNTCLGKRLADLAVKEISPILAASSKIPNLKDYASALGKVSRFDKVVIARVLSNHLELLARNRYLMSFDGYLALLTELSDRYSRMVCVNQTLPINWLAPIYGKDSSTRDYEAHLKDRKDNGFEIQRLTIASGDAILKQLSETYASLCRSETEPFRCVLWFLELFQALFDTDQDGLITKVSGYFGQNRSEDVAQVLLSRPDRAPIEDSLPPGIEEACADVPERIEREFIKTEEMCNILNKHILRKFFEVHKRSGSYYMKEEMLKEILRTSDRKKYGEIAVYYNRKGPKMAIATVGVLENSVRIEIVESSNIAASIDKHIVTAEESKTADFAGNLEDLITNET